MPMIRLSFDPELVFTTRTPQASGCKGGGCQGQSDRQSFDQLNVRSIALGMSRSFDPEPEPGPDSPGARVKCKFECWECGGDGICCGIKCHWEGNPAY
jgi:hypothetical protein